MLWVGEVLGYGWGCSFEGFGYGGWGVCVGGRVVFECCIGVWGVVRYVFCVDVFVPCGVCGCGVWCGVFWQSFMFSFSRLEEGGSEGIYCGLKL